MKLSNKSLAYLLVATLIVSFVGTFMSIHQIDRLKVRTSVSTTGLASQSEGNVTLTLSQVEQIEFVVASVDWGTGFINTSGGNIYCNLTTWDGISTDNTYCAGFNDLAGQPLVIKNTGTVNLSVTLNSSTNLTNGTDSFLNASASSPCNDCRFWWRIGDNETGSCEGTLGQNASWYNVSTHNPNVCTDMNYQEAYNTLRVDLNITIGQNAKNTQHNATFTVTGTA